MRHDQVQLQERGNHVRAVLTLPNGRTMQCVVNCASPAVLAGELDRLAGSELGADELGGRFLNKLKKAGKKVGKVALKPVKIAHKYTHQVGPIAALHKKVQEGVGKALPITKPFIKVHNSLAAPVHKAIEGKKIKAAVTAKEIAKVTKDIPVKDRGAVQIALVAQVKQSEALKSIGKAAAKAQVLTAAKFASAQGASDAKAFVRRAAQGTTGTYRVITPSGRTISVPASKVAHS
jgi:hypothetical protein